jgi:hypothetical protein
MCCNILQEQVLLGVNFLKLSSTIINARYSIVTIIIRNTSFLEHLQFQTSAIYVHIDQYYTIVINKLA